MKDLVNKLKQELKEHSMKESRRLEIRRAQIQQRAKEQMSKRTMVYTGSKSTAELHNATVVHSTDRKEYK